jgi:hypothetical protein
VLAAAGAVRNSANGKERDKANERDALATHLALALALGLSRRLCLDIALLVHVLLVDLLSHHGSVLWLAGHAEKKRAPVGANTQGLVLG